MSNDPRLDAATIAIIQEREQTPWLDSWAKAALVASDAADPLRRALTPGTDEHEAAVEQIARAVWESNAESDDGYGPWDDATPWDKDWGRSSVRAVLAALRDLA